MKFLYTTLLFLFLFSCAQMNDQDNPFDPGGNNWKPLVVKMEKTNDTVWINDSLTLIINKSDKSRNIGSVNWKINYPETTFTTDENILDFVFSREQLGRHIFTAHATDIEGVQAEENVKCTVEVKLGRPTIVIRNRIQSVDIHDEVTLLVSGIDTNGIVEYYNWRGNTINDTTTSDSLLSLSFSSGESHTITVTPIDDDGIEGLAKSFIIAVDLKKPIITQQNDTTVSQYDTVEIEVSAIDTNSGGSIQHYLWDYNNDGIWEDTGKTITIVNPEGGTSTIIWGAEDNDGVVVKDTFNIKFNRLPTTVEFADTVKNGKINWHGVDQDGVEDTLSYTLKIGLKEEELAFIYAGRDSFTVETLKHDTTYFFEIIAKDLFGDSVITKGTFHTPPPPQSGMVLIPAKDSSFIMGSAIGASNENPVHQVRFTTDFFMDTTEITQRQFDLLRIDLIYGFARYTPPPWSNDSKWGDNYPAYNVSWYDAMLYCNARSKMAGLDTVYTYEIFSSGFAFTGLDLSKNGFRLPTEAQWEYACRAGTTTEYYWGDSWSDVYDWPTSDINTVAQKLPNNYGLYDMSGNVWEWCNDWYSAYSSYEATDPSGPSEGYEKVTRGGGYRSPYEYRRSATRYFYSRKTRSLQIGFRCVLPSQ